MNETSRGNARKFPMMLCEELSNLLCPPLETSRTFFDSAEAPEALFILQVLGLSVVYKSINIRLGQGQDLIMSIPIQIYLKYKYT